MTDSNLPVDLSLELRPVLSLLTSRLSDLKLVYLFGSQASGEAIAGSDWDLAVLTGKRIDPLLRWELQQQLTQLLNADVDLVDLLDASTVLQMQVVSKGAVVLGNQHQADAFAMQVYSMYGNLQDGRQSHY